FLNAEIHAGYYPRETWGGLITLYGRYGVARAGNVWKHRRFTSWRQAVPPLFLVALATVGVLAFVHGAFGLGVGAVLGAYVLFDLGAATALAAGSGKWYLWPRLLAVFPSMHVAWALGFFQGLMLGLERQVLRRRRPA